MAKAEPKPDQLSTRARWAAVVVVGLFGVIGVLGIVKADRSPAGALATRASTAKTTQPTLMESADDSAKKSAETGSAMGLGSSSTQQADSGGEHTLKQDASALQTGTMPTEPQGAKDLGSSIRMRININTASAAQLDMLPRIGPALAARIIEDRTRNGPYRTLDDLDRVPGIGPKTIIRLVPFASVE